METKEEPLRVQNQAVSRKYMAVELEKFRPDSLVSCNLYICLNDSQKFILYKRKEIPMSFRDIERLMSNNISSLFIDSDDEYIIKDYLENNLSHYIQQSNIPLQKKSQLVYECATRRVLEVLKAPTSSENIRKSKDLVENIVRFIFLEGKTLENMMQMMSHHYDTYTHSVNVCTLCLSLAKFTGEYDKITLRQIGLGALLHDTGKYKIPQNILNKKEPLNAEEETMMRRHPMLGVEILKNSQFISPGSVVIIAQHHERYDGQGFPFKKGEKQIHRNSKITAIVNTFDSLTSKRINREPLKTFPALLKMKNEMNGSFDPHLFNQFVLMLKK